MELHLHATKVAPPLVVLVAVDGLVVHEVSVVSLEDGGQRDAPSLVPLRHLVGARPLEVHLSPGKADALYSEGAHGGVEGEDVKVSLTVEDEVASHGVENCSITVDPQSDVTWVQIILRESHRLP